MTKEQEKTMPLSAKTVRHVDILHTAASLLGGTRAFVDPNQPCLTMPGTNLHMKYRLSSTNNKRQSAGSIP
jgi:hypothetical protein